MKKILALLGLTVIAGIYLYFGLDSYTPIKRLHSQRVFQRWIDDLRKGISDRKNMSSEEKRIAFEQMKQYTRHFTHPVTVEKDYDDAMKEDQEYLDSLDALDSLGERDLEIINYVDKYRHPESK